MLNFLLVGRLNDEAQGMRYFEARAALIDDIALFSTERLGNMIT